MFPERFKECFGALASQKVVNMKGEPVEDTMLSIPGLQPSNYLRPFNQRVIVFLNGQHRGKIVGRSMPYWDERFDEVGIQLYDVLLDGHDVATVNVPEHIVYDVPEGEK